MADIVDSTTRSRMMAGIRSRDTVPEIQVRKALFARGFRFRLHVKGLPGRPDLVLPKYQTVVFVHGCFWHGHSCPLFRLPGSRRDFWQEKIFATQRRDRKASEALRVTGWRICTVWECALRGRNDSEIARLADTIGRWMHGSSPELELQGASEIDANN